MAGTGPYMESNEPFNPIPGLAAGSIFGAAIGGTAAGLGVKSANTIIDRTNAMRDKKMSGLESSISKAQSRLDQANLDSLSKPGMNWSTNDPRYGSMKNDYKALRNQKGELEQKLGKMQSKKIPNKIGGGRMAGIIGGTALGTSLIGGTLGAVGNYD